MTLDTLWTILLYCVVALAILAVLVIWVVILAATWFTVQKFMAQYAASKLEIERKEQVQRDLRYAERADPVD